MSMMRACALLAFAALLLECAHLASATPTATATLDSSASAPEVHARDSPYAILQRAHDDDGAPVGGLAGRYRGQHAIVVGAGAAGIAAARWLANRGVRVTLLEARARIGGRVHTDRASFGFPVEHGAQMLHGPNENPLSALANTFGLRRAVLSESNWMRFKSNGDAYTAAEQAIAHAEYRALLERVRAYRRTLYDRFGDRPLSDALSEFADGALDSPAVRWLLNFRIEDDIGAPLRDLSTIYFDSDARLNGTDVLLLDGYDELFHALLDAPDDAAIAVPTHAAASDVDARNASALGGPHAAAIRVRLSHVVTRVAYAPSAARSAITVTTDKGSFDADAVLVTLPLAVLQRSLAVSTTDAPRATDTPPSSAHSVVFDPPLSAQRAAAIGALKMGNVNRVTLQFASRFWPEHAHWMGIDCDRGRFCAWQHLGALTPHKGAALLTATASAQFADDMERMSDAQVVAAALDALHHMVGVQPPAPQTATVTRWRADEFAGGAYSYAPVGATDRDFDTIGAADRTDANPFLFFAGEHTTSKWRGTVHGAFVSGIRAAAQIVRALDASDAAAAAAHAWPLVCACIVALVM